MSMWHVPVYSQRSLNLCWEACARMLWAWKKGGLQGYEQAAGPYARLDRGLPQSEMTRFYQRLGLRVLPNPRGANLRHALKWTPVIITSMGEVQGHALVVCGHADGPRRGDASYTVINPCSMQTVSFDTDGGDFCEGGILQRPRDATDGRLGRYIWYW